MFTGEKMRVFAQRFGFWLVHSSPYYTQVNGQAEATNKVLIDMIKKTIKDKPKQWHKVLFEVIWAYRNSKNNATGLAPYRLTYGQDAMLPLKSAMKSFIVGRQYKL